MARSYQTHPYLQQRYNRVKRSLAFTATDRDEWRRWRRRTVGKLKALTGYDTMVKTALNPRITETVKFDDYSRQRVEITTEPGVIMPFYVLIPHDGEAPFPTVIAPHGHGSGGKASVAGCREIPAVAEAIDNYNYDYGVQFARAGFITFCPDARGFGERQEKELQSNFMNSSCARINHMAYSVGQTITGMWAWDLHRLLDYAETRDDCDGKRLGCAGLSGGGLQTLWAAALDKRIRCAVISGYLYGSKESLFDMQCCWCNYVPHLYEYVDMGDIAALIAPRSLLIETGTQDGLNGASALKNVRSQMRIMRKAYRLLGSGRQLKHVVFEGGHRWHGVEAIPWMQRNL